MYDFDPKKDYYEALWLSESATADEIKKAFRKLAVKHHPDRGWDKKKFQEINEAYQTLSDSSKRQQYDTVRKWGFWWFWDSGFWWWGFSWWSQFDFWGFDIGDVFWNLFWWWFWGHDDYSPRAWGKDIKKQIEITFDESFLWTEKKIAYTRKIISPDVESSSCSICWWSWRTVQQVRTPFGVMQTQWACKKCSWTGRIYTKHWKEISWWLEAKEEIIDIKIPAGIKEGVYLKFAWKWDQALSWQLGDLYLKIVILPSKLYRRKENDLYTRLDVSLFDLVLWWQHEVAHPEWKITVKIPKWTQVGDKIKLSWKWFWWSGVFSKKWDLYIETRVSVPKKLSKQQEKLWNELKKSQ